MAVNDMDDWLQHVAGVTNGQMRTNVIDAGLADVTQLHKQQEEFGHRIAQAVRKMGGTTQTIAQRRVSLIQEQWLKDLVVYCVYLYIVQRARTYQDATAIQV